MSSERMKRKLERYNKKIEKYDRKIEKKMKETQSMPNALSARATYPPPSPCPPGKVWSPTPVLPPDAGLYTCAIGAANAERCEGLRSARCPCAEPNIDPATGQPSPYPIKPQWCDDCCVPSP